MIAIFDTDAHGSFTSIKDTLQFRIGVHQDISRFLSADVKYSVVAVVLNKKAHNH